MSTKSTIISLVVLVLIVVGAWFWLVNGNDKSGVTDGEVDPVAVVNGEEVSRTQFNNVRMQVAAGQGVDVESLSGVNLEQLDAQVIDIVIAQILLQQKVEEAGVEVEVSSINEQFESVKGQFESEEAFEQALAADGLTAEELKNRIEVDLRTQIYLNQAVGLDSVTASDEEVKAVYDQTVTVQGEEAEVPAFEEVREQIESSIIAQKQQQKIAELVDRLRGEAEVEVYIN